MIDSPRELAGVVASAARAAVLAVDTEFMSEDTYYPLLCLVSLAWPGGAAVVDALAVDDLSGLGALLADGDRTVVMHGSSQDLPLLRRRAKAVPARLFDTQMAGAFLGYGQSGYGRLVEAVLDTTLPKAAGFTDWSRRPLATDQIAYACQDARLLLPLHEQLRSAAEARGRLAWVEEECVRLVVAGSGERDPLEVWRRVDGARRLKPKELAVLRELAAWREATAARLNIPVGYVARDVVLTTLSMRPPGSLEELSGTRGLSEGQVRKHGRGVMDAIRAGLAQPRDQWPAWPKPPAEEPEGKLISDVLYCWIQKRAGEEDVLPSLLATRDDLDDFRRWIHAGASGEGPAVVQGWRGGLVGQDLLDIVAGRVAVRIERGRVVLERPLGSNQAH